MRHRREKLLTAAVMMVSLYSLAYALRVRTKAAPPPAPYTLKMYGTGVAAFWPENGAWKAIFPKWAHGARGRHGKYIPPHRPFLLIPTSGVTFGGRKPGLRFTPPKGLFRGRECGLFLLDNQWLALRGATPANSGTPSDPEIVSLNEVCSSATARSLVHGEDPDFVGGRVDLAAGRLKAGSLSKDPWDFTPPRETNPQRPKAMLPQEVIIDFTFPGSISFVRSASAGQKWAELEPIEITAAQNLEVLLGNGTLDDILGIGPDTHIEPTDPHFELLFQLMNHPGKPHIPQSVPKFAEGSNCPPGTWPWP